MYALSLKASFLLIKTMATITSGIQNCGRVIEPMVQRVGFAVGSLPTTSTSHDPPDKCSQFPVFRYIVLFTLVSMVTCWYYSFVIQILTGVRFYLHLTGSCKMNTTFVYSINYHVCSALVWDLWFTISNLVLRLCTRVRWVNPRYHALLPKQMRVHQG